MINKNEILEWLNALSDEQLAEVLSKHRRYRLLKIELEAKESSNCSEEEIKRIKTQLQQLLDYNENITAIYNELTENVLRELKNMKDLENK